MMEPEYLADGIVNLFFVLVSLIICIYISSRYIPYRDSNFLLIGISWLGFAMAYIPHALSFLYFLIFEEPLDLVIYLSFYGLVAVMIAIWLTAMQRLLKTKSNIPWIFAKGICAAFSILYYILLIIDPHLLGAFTEKYHMHMSFTLFTKVYFLAMIAIFMTTGMLFSLRCFRSSRTEIRLKGKILLVGFVSSCAGAFMTSHIEVVIVRLIARLILLSSAIEFYCGYILPDWVRTIFIRSERGRRCIGCIYSEHCPDNPKKSLYCRYVILRHRRRMKEKR